MKTITIRKLHEQTWRAAAKRFGIEREEYDSVTGSAFQSPGRARLIRMDPLRSLREITTLFVNFRLIGRPRC